MRIYKDELLEFPLQAPATPWILVWFQQKLLPCLALVIFIQGLVSDLVSSYSGLRATLVVVALLSLGGTAWGEPLKTTFSAPTTYSVAALCSVSATATASPCAAATNTYSATISVTLTNPVAGTLTVSLPGSTPISQTLTAATGSFKAVFTGLPSDGASHIATISLPGCGTATATYSAPASCAQLVGNPLALNKFVDKSKARIGDILSYSLVLTNTGTIPVNNVVVTDVMTTGLTYVLNSATPPAGTTFTQGNSISIWTIASISSGHSLLLTFQAIADSSGILYNTATIPGDTASVCTSVPFIVCTGDQYKFTLTALPGRSSYKWFRDNVEITGQTTNTLDVTAPGTYSLAVNNAGKCPDFSCCPFIVEEDTLPTFQAKAVAITCTGNTTLANGKIVLSNFKSGYTYQYSAGSDFNPAASLSGLSKAIPANGVIISNLSNPGAAQSYTIRVYNAAGCYTDVMVILLPTVCGCPTDVCVPLVIKQTRGTKRNG